MENLLLVAIVVFIAYCVYKLYNPLQRALTISLFASAMQELEELTKEQAYKFAEEFVAQVEREGKNAPK